MAVVIPIITEFGGKGLKKAIAEFKRLETNGQKAAFLLKKAFKGIAIGAAALGAAVAAAGVAMWNFAKAASEDQTSQVLLAKQLKTTTKATNAQIASVEKWITQLQLANGVADSALRPNLAKLVRATKSVGKAQKLLTLALDVSAGSGRDLDSVVTSLVRAYNGNLGGLTRLGISLDKSTIKSKDFKKAQQELQKQFAGAAAAKAATFDGKVRSLGEAFNELKETIGYAILPTLTKVMDAGIAIAQAFGKGGAAGAIKELSHQMGILFYDEKGNINAAGKQLNHLIGLFNTLAKAGIIAGAATAGGVFGPIGAVIGAAAGTGYVLGGGAPSIPQMGGFNQQRRSEAFLNKTPAIVGGPAGAYGAAGVNVTVNVYGGNPDEVVRHIRKYTQRNGAIGGRFLPAGSPG